MSAERAKVLSRTWYDGIPPCVGELPEGMQCDEYPYFASAQSGPGASLRYIDGSQCPRGMDSAGSQITNACQ